MHFLKQLRFVAALLAAFFVLSLTACGSGSNSFTWFVDSIPANLDPQVASSASDIIACENLYSGLVRRTPDGSLAPELCERWEVSADRLTYTFYLKDGLTSASTLSSGHFYLYNWTSSGLFLRRAASGNQIDSLRLVENTTSSGQSAEELINNEKCTAALDDSGTPTSLQSVSYSDTTWALLFNCDSIFASTELRQALGSAAASAVEVPGGGLFAEAKGLIPDGLTVDGIDYRKAAGDVRPAFGDPRALYIAARDGGVSPSDFGRVSLLLPFGSGLSDTAELINSAWQKEFSLFFSVEEVEPEEFQKRLENGSYTIALAPVQAEGGSVYTALAQFSPTGGGLTGYSDALYTTQLSASATATGSTRCSLLAACERQLLEQAVAVPLFTQQKRLLVANGIEGLVFDPFGPVLDVTYATKS